MVGVIVGTAALGLIVSLFGDRYECSPEEVQAACDELSNISNNTLQAINEEIGKNVTIVNNAAYGYVDISNMNAYAPAVQDSITNLMGVLDKQAQIIEEYNNGSLVEKMLGTGTMAILNLTEGVLKFGEDIVDAGANIIAGVGTFCGFDMEEVELWAAKDLVGGVFDYAFENGPFKLVEKYSIYSHESTAAEILKGVGTAIPYIALAATGVGLVAEAGIAGAAGFGRGSTNYQQQHLVYDANGEASFDDTYSTGSMMWEGTKQGAFDAALTVGMDLGIKAIGKGIGKGIRKLRAGRKGIGEVADDVVGALDNGADDVVRALDNGADDTGKALINSTDNVANPTTNAVRKTDYELTEELNNIKKAVKEGKMTQAEGDAAKKIVKRQLAPVHPDKLQGQAAKSLKETTEQAVKETTEQAARKAANSGYDVVKVVGENADVIGKTANSGDDVVKVVVENTDGAGRAVANSADNAVESAVKGSDSANLSQIKQDLLKQYQSGKITSEEMIQGIQKSAGNAPAKNVVSQLDDTGRAVANNADNAVESAVKGSDSANLSQIKQDLLKQYQSGKITSEEMIQGIQKSAGNAPAKNVVSQLDDTGRAVANSADNAVESAVKGSDSANLSQIKQDLLKQYQSGKITSEEMIQGIQKSAGNAPAKNVVSQLDDTGRAVANSADNAVESAVKGSDSANLSQIKQDLLKQYQSGKITSEEMIQGIQKSAGNAPAKNVVSQLDDTGRAAANSADNAVESAVKGSDSANLSQIKQDLLKQYQSGKITSEEMIQGIQKIAGNAPAKNVVSQLDDAGRTVANGASETGENAFSRYAKQMSEGEKLKYDRFIRGTDDAGKAALKNVDDTAKNVINGADDTGKALINSTDNVANTTTNAVRKTDYELTEELNNIKKAVKEGKMTQAEGDAAKKIVKRQLNKVHTDKLQGQAAKTVKETTEQAVKETTEQAARKAANSGYDVVKVVGENADVIGKTANSGDDVVKVVVENTDDTGRAVANNADNAVESAVKGSDSANLSQIKQDLLKQYQSGKITSEEMIQGIQKSAGNAPAKNVVSQLDDAGRTVANGASETGENAFSRYAKQMSEGEKLKYDRFIRGTDDAGKAVANSADDVGKEVVNSADDAVEATVKGSDSATLSQTKQDLLKQYKSGEITRDEMLDGVRRAANPEAALKADKAQLLNDFRSGKITRDEMIQGIQKSAGNAPAKNVVSQLDDAGRAVANSADDVGKAVVENADDIGKAVINKADDAGKAALKNVDDTAKNVINGVDDAGRAVANSADDVGKAVVENADDTGKALANSADDVGKEVVNSADDAVEATVKGSDSATLSQTKQDLLKQYKSGEITRDEMLDGVRRAANPEAALKADKAQLLNDFRSGKITRDEMIQGIQKSAGNAPAKNVVSQLDDAGRAVANSADDVGKAVVENADDIGKAVINKADDAGKAALKNVDDTAKNVINGVDDAGRAVANSADDVGKAVVENADDIGKAVINKADDAGKAALKNVDDTAKNVINGVDDAGRAVANSADDVGKAVVENADDTGKALANSADDVGKEVVNSADDAVEATVKGSDSATLSQTKQDLLKQYKSGEITRDEMLDGVRRAANPEAALKADKAQLLNDFRSGKITRDEMIQGIQKSAGNAPAKNVVSQLDDAGRAVANSADDVGKAVVENADDIGKAVINKADDAGKAALKNVDDTAKNVINGVDDAGRAVANSADDVGKAVVENADDIGKAVINKADDAGKAALKNVDDTAKNVINGVDDAGKARNAATETAEQTARKAASGTAEKATSKAAQSGSKWHSPLEATTPRAKITKAYDNAVEGLKNAGAKAGSATKRIATDTAAFVKANPKRALIGGGIIASEKALGNMKTSYIPTNYASAEVQELSKVGGGENRIVIDEIDDLPEPTPPEPTTPEPTPPEPTTPEPTPPEPTTPKPTTPKPTTPKPTTPKPTPPEPTPPEPTTPEPTTPEPTTPEPTPGDNVNTEVSNPPSNNNQGSSGTNHGGTANNNTGNSSTGNNNWSSNTTTEPGIEENPELEPELPIENPDLIDEPNEEESVYTIPSNLSGVKTTKKTSSGSSVLPILGGLGAAAAVGVGAKMYLDNKKNNENGDDEDYSEENDEDFNFSENNDLLADEWNGEDTEFNYEDPSGNNIAEPDDDLGEM